MYDKKAVRTLAELAREDVPDSVIRAHGGKPIRFGADYIIPKPLDSRVLLMVTPAVANAAVASGVARVGLPSPQAYLQDLETRLGPEREVMRKIIFSAQQNPKRIVLPEGNHPTILRAAHQVAREGIAMLSFSNFGSTRHPDAGNAAYKLLNQLGGAKAVGPFLMSISKPFNVLQRDTDMENVVNVIAFTVIQSR